MSQLDYYDTTVADLMTAHHFYVRRKDQEETELWKQTRILGWVMLRMWADPKTAPATPMDWFKLPGDAATEGTVDIETMTPEEQKQIFANLRAEGWKV